jgi:murein DD-endopeptidase MepM/ murein hydrolase activator NlpD
VLPTADLSNYIYGVMTATPQFDGTVTHVVQYGQTLLTIAQAYGITVEELRTLNGFAPDFTAIWPDDVLIIRKGTGASEPTATAETTPTATPTLTPRPTYTPSNLELTATVLAASATAEAETESAPSSLTAGMLLLVLAGLGLVMVVFMTTGKEQGEPPKDEGRS